MYHGNLDSIRTLIDVRDAMSSYWEASQVCRWGESYNIGGGTTLSVSEFLEKLILKARVPITTRLNHDLLRPKDVTLQVPDISKFNKITDWQPKYTIDDSIDFLLSHYRGENV